MTGNEPRSRHDPYRIAQGDRMDPDLYKPPAPDWEQTGAVYATDTSRALDEAHRAVREGGSSAAHVLTVTCLPSIGAAPAEPAVSLPPCTGHRSACCTSLA